MGPEPSTPKALSEMTCQLHSGMTLTLCPPPALVTSSWAERTLYLGLVKTLSGNDLKTETKLTAKFPNS